MKTPDICYKCTLREMLAKLLSRGESWSSGLVPTRSMSAQRLPATHKTGVFIAKKWWKIMHDRWMTSLVLSSSANLDFWWENGLTNGQTVFPRV